MPKVTIVYYPGSGKYVVGETSIIGYDPETGMEAVMDMKASHLKNIRRNIARIEKDQSTLENFFIQAMIAGREIREQ